MISQRLENLAEKIKQEILTTGTVVVGGMHWIKNSLSENPYAGLCDGAVEKLRELAPDLDIVVLSFERSGKDCWKRGRHVVAEVSTSEGVFRIDSTIEQYIPGAKAVYGSNEIYPIVMCGGTIRKAK